MTKGLGQLLEEEQDPLLVPQRKFSSELHCVAWSVLFSCDANSDIVCCFAAAFCAHAWKKQQLIHRNQMFLISVQTRKAWLFCYSSVDQCYGDIFPLCLGTEITSNLSPIECISHHAGMLWLYTNKGDIFSQTLGWGGQMRAYVT